LNGGKSGGMKMPDIRPGSAGFPMPGILPEIVDEREGKPCDVNEKGNERIVDG
jgi:acetyl-CoA synthetase